MDSEFDFIQRVERGECSLAELIRINYRMNEIMGKRRRGFRIALGVFLAVVAVYAIVIAFGFINSRNFFLSRDSTIVLGVICLFAVVVFALMFVAIDFTMIRRPHKRYQAALQAGYPGIDASSEAAMKAYVWNYVGDPCKLLGNLSALIERTGGQRWVRGEAARGQYTSAEQVVLDLWQYAPEPYHELYDLQVSGDSEMEYLGNVVNSFNAIGAADEADAWLEVGELFGELRVWDGEGELVEDSWFKPEEENWARYKRPATGECVWVWDVDENGGEYRVFTEAQRERFLEFEERIATCHDDTQAKLYEFVLLNRILFGFEQPIQG